jgi:L-ascorbate metabolism protein UlaG (beta-lactamase superfamily)
MRTFIFIMTLTIVIMFPLIASAESTTKITWYGQSAFRVVTPKGKILYIDPWITNPANKNGQEDLAKIDRADLIFLTHGHWDHIGDSLEIAKKTGARLVATFDLSKAMVLHGGFPEKQATRDTAGAAGGEIKMLDGEVTVTFTPAVHGSTLEATVDGKKDLVAAGMPGGFVIAIKDGPTIYHTGDTDLFSDMALIGSLQKIDLMLVCIGDHFTMGPRRAAEAVRLVKPGIAIPMHFGTYPLLTGTAEEFIAELSSKGKSSYPVKRMTPGETLVWPLK